MKKCVAVILLGLALTGCSISPAFLDGVEAQWQAIGPNYRAYVAADESIDDVTRQVRIFNAEVMDELLQWERARWQQ